MCYTNIRKILETSCSKAKFNEMAVAEAQIAKVRDTSRRYHYLGTSDEEIVMSRDSFPAKSFGEIYHLRRRIETAYQILFDVSFDVEKGEVFGFLG